MLSDKILRAILHCSLLSIVALAGCGEEASDGGRWEVGEEGLGGAALEATPADCDERYGETLGPREAPYEGRPPQPGKRYRVCARGGFDLCSRQDPWRRPTQEELNRHASSALFLPVAGAGSCASLAVQAFGPEDACPTSNARDGSCCWVMEVEVTRCP